MKRHTRTYMRHHGYGEQDFVPCEVCGSRCVDVHHIHGRISDDIDNLIGLCRACHTDAHDGKITKDELLNIKT